MSPLVVLEMLLRARVADRRRSARVGDRDDDVTLGGVLFGEALAEELAHAMHAAPVDDRVGAREVDVLEDAEALPLVGERANAAEALRVDATTISARLDLAHHLGFDEVEGGLPDAGTRTRP